MWVVIGIVILGVIIVLIEFPPLLKQKHVKDILVFFIILIFAVTVNILQYSGIKLPNPLEWILTIFRPFSKLIYDQFESK